MAKLNVGMETGSWLNIVLGLVALSIVAWEGFANTVPVWTATIGGLLLVAIGGFTAWAAATDRARTAIWPSALALLVGAWLAIYPWTFVPSDLYFYGIVGIGLAAFLTSGVEMWMANRAESRPGSRRPMA